MPYQPFFIVVDCGPTRKVKPLQWRVRGVRNLPYDGHPTPRNLEAWVKRFEARRLVTVWRAEIIREGHDEGRDGPIAVYVRQKSQVQNASPTQTASRV